MSNERWEKGKRVFLETKGSASDPSSCAEHIGGVCAALTGAEPGDGDVARDARRRHGISVREAADRRQAITSRPDADRRTERVPPEGRDPKTPPSPSVANRSALFAGTQVERRTYSPEVNASLSCFYFWTGRFEWTVLQDRCGY